MSSDRAELLVPTIPDRHTNAIGVYGIDSPQRVVNVQILLAANGPEDAIYPLIHRY